jgi:L-threonylcarbamoyladenylate synthase
MTDDELALALSTLSRGGVVAAATETFFGLLADAREPRALDALFELKGRSREKGVALLIPDRAAWRALVTEVPPLAELLADHFWPGPLTVALPASAELDRRLTVDGTVAVRWAAASDAAAIAAAFGASLTATSANVAGAPPCVTSEGVRSAFAEPVARGELWVVSGSAPGGEPSTLVAVDADRVRVLRPGRIRESDLVRALPASVLR